MIKRQCYFGLLPLLLLFGCGPGRLLPHWNELDSHPKKDKIILRCGVGCLTVHQANPHRVGLSKANLKAIQTFLAKQSISDAVLVSPCEKNRPTALFMESIARAVFSRGYRVVKVRSTLPFRIGNRSCVNLVRGPIMMYPPSCKSVNHARGNFMVPRGVSLVGHNFGCYYQKNLAAMLDDPYDLLVLSGVSGKIK